jgi:hypothetical protein
VTGKSERGETDPDEHATIERRSRSAIVAAGAGVQQMGERGASSLRALAPQKA